jgi:hypothetical protein
MTSARPAPVAAALWEEIERRVRERGVRVPERLALLAHLRGGDDGAERLARRREEGLEALRRAAAAVRREET